MKQCKICGHLLSSSLNCLSTCKGIITRRRVLDSRIEEAVLDFCLINEKLRPFFKEMLIDEDRMMCLSNIAQMKKNGRIIESDHNSMVVEFNLEINKRKPDREEMFNLRNKDCQKVFKEETEKNPELLDCFNNCLPVDVQSKRWFKRFKSLLYKSFKKVRIVNNKRKENSQMKHLLNEINQMRVELKQTKISEEMRIKVEKRIKEIEEDMENEVTEEHQKVLIETLRELSGDDDTINGNRRKQMWKLLKKKFPKISTAVPVGKKDRKGNIITNHEGLKHLYLQTYVNRLRNSPIKPDFEEIRRLKMELFELRLKLSKNTKRPALELRAS